MPAVAVVNQEAATSLACLHGCDGPIIGVYYMPSGCICFPDKVQALCAYHWHKICGQMLWPVIPLITFDASEFQVGAISNIDKQPAKGGE